MEFSLIYQYRTYKYLTFSFSYCFDLFLQFSYFSLENSFYSNFFVLKSPRYLLKRIMPHFLVSNKFKVFGQIETECI